MFGIANNFNFFLNSNNFVTIMHLISFISMFVFQCHQVVESSTENAKKSLITAVQTDHMML